MPSLTGFNDLLTRIRDELRDGFTFAEFKAWLESHRGDRAIRFEPENCQRCPLALYVDQRVGVASVSVDELEVRLLSYSVMHLTPWQSRFMLWFDEHAWGDRVGVDELLEALPESFA